MSKINPHRAKADYYKKLPGGLQAWAPYIVDHLMCLPQSDKVYRELGYVFEQVKWYTKALEYYHKAKHTDGIDRMRIVLDTIVKAKKKKTLAIEMPNAEMAAKFKDLALGQPIITDVDAYAAWTVVFDDPTPMLAPKESKESKAEDTVIVGVSLNPRACMRCLSEVKEGKEITCPKCQSGFGGLFCSFNCLGAFESRGFHVHNFDHVGFKKAIATRTVSGRECSIYVAILLMAAQLHDATFMDKYVLRYVELPEKQQLKHLVPRLWSQYIGIMQKLGVSDHQAHFDSFVRIYHSVLTRNLTTGDNTVMPMDKRVTSQSAIIVNPGSWPTVAIPID